MQVYQLSTADYCLALRTVMSVFPHCGLMRISDGDTLLLASTEPLVPTKATVLAAQVLVDSSPEVSSDLQKYFDTADVRSLLLMHYLLDERGLRGLVDQNSSDTINTDMNLRLEFDAPLRLFRERQTTHEVGRSILAATDDLWLLSMCRDWDCSEEQVEVLRRVAAIYAQHDLQTCRRQICDFALQVSPSDPYFLAEKLILSPPSADRSAFEDAVGALATASAEQASRAGVAFWQSNDHARAVSVFRAVVSVKPESASAWTNLAINCDAAGSRPEAAEAFQKAISLDPFNEFAERQERAFRNQQDAARSGETPFRLFEAPSSGGRQR